MTGPAINEVLAASLMEVSEGWLFTVTFRDGLRDADQLKTASVLVKRGESYTMDTARRLHGMANEYQGQPYP